MPDAQISGSSPTRLIPSGFVPHPQSLFANPHSLPLHLCLGFDGVFPHGEMCRSLLLLLGDSAGILLAQSAADGAGLLGSQVEGEILLLLVEETELVALVRVDDGEGAGDGFAEIVSRFFVSAVCPPCF